MERPIALVVDPDPSVRAAIRDALARRDIALREASAAAEATHPLAALDLLVVDVSAHGDGLPAHVREALGDPFGPLVVALAGRETSLLELLRAGCLDVVRKPLDATELDVVVARAARQAALLRQARRLRDAAREGGLPQPIVGHSAAIEEIRRQLKRLATGRDPVCVTGEIGTGKEFIARVLHERSGGGPFVPVGGAVLAARTWDARWFGEAPSGAPGLLARVGDGTLFLEEFPELSLDLQSRLLQTLAHRAPAGSSSGPGEARLVVSSRRPLGQVVEEGGVLPELARAVAARTLELPPLRDRREDIATLARHFVTTICEINRLPEIRLSSEAVERLERYRWPANVQELRNAMEQAVILAEDGVIRPRDLPDRVRDAAGPAALHPADPPVTPRLFRDAKREVVERFEQTYLKRLMQDHGGNVTAASQQAGMLRSALQRLLRKYGLRSVEFRRRRSAPQAEPEQSAPGAAIDP